MDFTCVIERAGNTAPDEGGQDVAGDWEALPPPDDFPEGQPCYFKPESTELDTERGEYVKSSPTLKLPFDTDVTLQDRITQIKDRAGVEVQPGTFEITALTPRRGSILLTLADIS